VAKAKRKAAKPQGRKGKQEKRRVAAVEPPINETIFSAGTLSGISLRLGNLAFLRLGSCE
jgi:hypothetical protein